MVSGHKDCLHSTRDWSLLWGEDPVNPAFSEGVSEWNCPVLHTVQSECWPLTNLHVTSSLLSAVVSCGQSKEKFQLLSHSGNKQSLPWSSGQSYKEHRQFLTPTAPVSDQWAITCKHSKLWPLTYLYYICSPALAAPCYVQSVKRVSRSHTHSV